MGNSSAVRHLILRYVNGILYWDWNETSFSYSRAVEIAAEIGNIETQLVNSGITDEQVRIIFEVSKSFKDLGLKKCVEANMKIIMSKAHIPQ